MDTFTFGSKDEFLEWARRIVKEKNHHFSRTPVPEQVWTYGDGHVEKTGYGKKGGKMLANLSFLLNTGTGKLAHPKELRLVENIDNCGGMSLTIRWPERIAKDGAKYAQKS